jgi:hypothetical protein
MKEVPNHVMFSEMEEIHVSACSSNTNDISDNPLSVLYPRRDCLLCPNCPNNHSKDVKYLKFVLTFC